MLNTLTQAIKDTDLMQLGRRREWRAFKQEVERTRLQLDRLIGSGELVEVVFAALDERAPYLHQLQVEYAGKPGLITGVLATSAERDSQKVSSEDLGTAVQIARLYMKVYDYAQERGYDPGALDEMIGRSA